MIDDVSGMLFKIPGTSVQFFSEPLSISFSTLYSVFVNSRHNGRAFFTGDQVAHLFECSVPVALAKTKNGENAYVYAICVTGMRSYLGSMICKEAVGGCKILWSLSYAHSSSLSELVSSVTTTTTLHANSIFSQGNVAMPPPVSLFDAKRNFPPSVRPGAIDILGATVLEDLSVLSSSDRVLIALLCTGRFLVSDGQTGIVQYFRSAAKQRCNKRTLGENAEITQIRSRVGASPKFMTNVLRAAALSPSNWNGWYPDNTITVKATTTTTMATDSSSGQACKRWCLRRIDSNSHVLEHMDLVESGSSSSSNGDGTPDDMEVDSISQPPLLLSEECLDDVHWLIVDTVISNILSSPSPARSHRTFVNICCLSKRFKQVAYDAVRQRLEEGCNVMRDFVTQGTNPFNDHVLSIQRYSWKYFSCPPTLLLKLSRFAISHRAFFKQRSMQRISEKIINARSGRFIDSSERDHIVCG